MTSCHIIVSKNNQIIIPIRIEFDNGITIDSTGLLDTGASSTCIDQKVLNFYHATPIRTSTMSTASAKNATTSIYKTKITIFSKTFEIIASAVILGDAFSALIGMDIIKEYNLSLSSYNNKFICYLSEKNV